MRAVAPSLAFIMRQMTRDAFNEGDHPRAPDGKFGSGGGKSGNNAASQKLHNLPADKMRDYTPKELDWEYEVEYGKYSKDWAPDAFSSREDFQEKFDAAPLVHLTDDQFKGLENSMASSGIGKNESWVHRTFSHRRDSARIIKTFKEGQTAPPIVLKKGNRLRLMAGQTRLATGAALGYHVPVKVIDVGKKSAQDEGPGGKFNEGDHPRDADGKFASGAGGGGAAAEETTTEKINKKYGTGSNLWSFLKNTGYKKVTGANAEGKPEYFNPATGVKVVIEPPPEGKATSVTWSLSTGEQGVGVPAIDKLLKLAEEKASQGNVAQMEKALEEAGSTPELQHSLGGFTENIHNNVGLNYTVKQDGIAFQVEGPGVKGTFNAVTGKWVMQAGDGPWAKGKGTIDFEDALNAAKPDEKKPGAYDLEGVQLTAPAGMTITEMPSGLWVFANGDGNQAYFDPAAGKWSLKDNKVQGEGLVAMYSAIKAAQPAPAKAPASFKDIVKQEIPFAVKTVEVSPNNFEIEGSGKFGTYDANYNTKTGDWTIAYGEFPIQTIDGNSFSDFKAKIENVTGESAPAKSVLDAPAALNSFAAVSKEASAISKEYETTKLADGAYKIKGHGGMFVFYPVTGNWQGEADGEPVGGDDVDSLYEELYSQKQPKIDTKKPDAVKEATAAASAKTDTFALPLEAKGYKAFSAGSQPGSVLFKAAEGKYVQVSPETDDWIVETQGYPSKQGKGIDNLTKLLSGEKVKELPGGGYTWNNTNEVIDPTKAAQAKKAAEALKAQQEAQAAKTAEAKKKAAEKLAAFTKDMKEASDDNQAELLRQKVAAWRDTPKGHEAEALSAYKGSAYKALNQNLRFPHMYKESSSHKQLKSGLDSYLMRNTVKEDFVVFRTANNDAGFVDQLMNMAFVGARLQDKGYMSTTTNPHLGFASGVTFKINVKAGTKGASIRAAHESDGEREFLVPRGSAFVVKSFDPVNRYLEVDLDQSHFDEGAK